MQYATPGMEIRLDAGNHINPDDMKKIRTCLKNHSFNNKNAAASTMALLTTTKEKTYSASREEHSPVSEFEVSHNVHTPSLRKQK